MPVYKIREELARFFDKKVNKLVSLCKKYDLDFTFKDLGTMYEYEEGCYVKYHNYIIEDPVDDTGWRLLARINHTDSGNIVERVSSEDIPRNYYYDKGKCDHCHTDRNRKRTYIIKSKSGEIKQVGVKCSQEYICNRFFEWTAAWFKYLSELMELESYEFQEKNIEYHKSYYPVKDVIAYSIEAINKSGYKKEGGVTKNQVIESIENGTKIDHAYYDLADKIFDWVLSLDDISDYIHNMQIYFKEGFIGYNGLALVVSVVPYYEGHMNRLEASKKSSHKYSVGDKIVIRTNDFRKVTTLNTMYGIMHIYRFTDEDDNVYVWKTGKLFGSDVSSVSGTVKACNEYNGEKQTELTRCKVKSININ